MATFRQRNPLTGALQFDSGAGDMAAIMIGSFTIDYSSNPDGSMQVPALSGARPFAFVRGDSYLGIPNVTISGATLSWQRTPTRGGNYLTSGSWDVLYGASELLTLGGAGGARLTLRNNAGKIIFTSLYGLYQHIGRGAPAKQGTGYQRADAWLISPAGSVNAGRMVALRPTGRKVGVTGTYFTAAGPAGVRLVAQSGWTGAGDFYLIEKPTLVAAKPGLNCRSPATGELTFSSAQQTVRAVDFIAGQPGTWTGTPGRVYAAVFSGAIGYHGDEETPFILSGGQIVAGPSPPYWVWRGYSLAVQVRNGSPHILDFSWLQHSGDDYGVAKSSPQPPIYNTGTIMIIDVTDL